MFAKVYSRVHQKSIEESDIFVKLRTDIISLDNEHSAPICVYLFIYLFLIGTSVSIDI